jgi:enoyl-CoA hydratase
VIAAVNGPAFGGGFSLALAGDLRLCSPDARFCASFVKFGIAGCELGVSYLLPKIVGATAAFEMMLTGRTVGADEAFRTGLVLEVVDGGALLDRALELAGRIAANSPFGVAMTKRLAWRNLGATHFEGAMELEMHTQALLFRTEDHLEALHAFQDRRPADYRYR